MFQIQNTTKLHPFAAYSNIGAAATTLTTPSVKYRINGGAVVELEDPVIDEYDEDMGTFLITIPATLAVTAYDSVEVYIHATEGDAHLLIDIAPDYSAMIYKLRNKSKFLR